MNAVFWKKLACAAALCLSTSFAYQSFASPGRCSAPSRQIVEAAPVLRGEGLLTFAGYQLNVAFTPDGALLGFDISAQ